MNRFYPVHRLAQPRIPRAWSRACRPTLSSYLQRRLVSSSAQDVENTNVAHSRFLAEAESTAKWKDAGKKDPSSVNAAHEDFDTIEDGKGMLLVCLLSSLTNHLMLIRKTLPNILPLIQVDPTPPQPLPLYEAKRPTTNSHPPPPLPASLPCISSPSLRSTCQNAPTSSRYHVPKHLGLRPAIRVERLYGRWGLYTRRLSIGAVFYMCRAS